MMQYIIYPRSWVGCNNVYSLKNYTARNDKVKIPVTMLMLEPLAITLLARCIFKLEVI